MYTRARERERGVEGERERGIKKGREEKEMGVLGEGKRKTGEEGWG